MNYTTAISKATKWARENQGRVGNAGAALAYLNNIGAARAEAKQYGQSPNYGEYVQLLYVMNNLGQWRGPEAKEAKLAIKARIKELKGKRNPTKEWHRQRYNQTAGELSSELITARAPRKSYLMGRKDEADYTYQVAVRQSNPTKKRKVAKAGLSIGYLFVIGTGLYLAWKAYRNQGK